VRTGEGCREKQRCGKKAPGAAHAPAPAVEPFLLGPAK
jgi:hypothetical protein